MSDIYLSLTETPSVVTLSQPVIGSSVAATVTVGNTVTVALDANSLSALENVTVTVGAAVSVSNFPSTQTVAGTVTANLVGWDGGNLENVRIGGYSVGEGNAGRLALEVIGVDGNPLSISGTVTANCIGQKDHNDGVWGGKVVPVQIIRTDEDIAGTSGAPLIVAFDTNSGSTTVTVSNSVTIGSLPAISGTVTAAASNGSLTTRFGTPTTASVAFATSCVTNANRKYLLIQNVTTGSNVITVGIGFTPTTTQGIQLTAGAGITFESSYIPTGQIFVLSSVTASNFTILEA